MKKRREKIFSKGLAFTLALSLLAAPFSSAYLNVSAMVNTNEDYVVVTSENLNGTKLMEILDLSEIDVANNNVISTAELSEKQAHLMSKDKNVITLEKDIMLKGSSTMDIEDDFDYQAVPEQNNITEKLPVKNEILWNLEMIGVNEDTSKLPVQEKVKVAILDSGVDYRENIEVKERVNLIPNTAPSIFFEDTTGHGTAIASILVGSHDNLYSNVKGVNPNIELYSARILDENNEAPLSRVLEGIYWAIDRNVNIISISFGSVEYSDSLKMAIDDAVSRGILVVAAAGNNGINGAVEYPAALENVVSVGAINSQGYISELTSTDGSLDVVAPGIAIRVTGFFGEEALASGTSIAVPHVVGLSSLLWQEDLSKDNQFIRTVLETSSKSILEETAEVGLIDYNYAKSIYDTVEEQYQHNIPIDVEPNQTEFSPFDNSEDEMTVRANWVGEVHEYVFTTLTQTDEIKAMRKGATYQDKSASGLNGMKDYPEWHGYFRLELGVNSEPTNYIAVYRYLIKIANEYGKVNGKYDTVTRSEIPGLSLTAFERIRTAFQNGLHSYILNQFSTRPERKAFLFGMAMHTATDTFAHSTYERVSATSPWTRIKHTTETTPPRADNTNVKPRRHKMALKIEENVLDRFKQLRTTIPVGHDFHSSVNTTQYYDATVTSPAEQYVVANLRSYAVSAGITDTTVLSHFSILDYTNTNYSGANGD